ncbi:MAG: endoglucanase [Thermotogaceae bacterium]|nr:endoglucanase [Thermotogaceae bacterium]
MIKGVDGVNKKIKDMLFEFSQAYGPPGREEGIRTAIKKRLEGLCDEISVDKSGNLIAVKHATEKTEGRFMVSTHMDEVCLLCSRVLDTGYLRVEPVGFDPKLLPSQKVTVHTKSGEQLRGVVGMLAPHLQTQETKSKISDYDDLFVDVSMHDPKKFSVGDFITFDSESFESTPYVFAKTIDNRGSCIASIVALEYLKKMRHTFDFYAVFSSREEIGAFGARTATSLIQPDVSIALDVTHGDVDMPGHIKLETGKGPVIAKGPVLTKIVSKGLIDCAQDNGIAFQYELLPSRTGTDADQIQLEGFPVGLISIPLAYMHTTFEKINVGDIKETGRLLALFGSELKRSFVKIQSDEEGEKECI